MILAIETATDVCSVALQDARGIIHERRSREKGSHSELVYHHIDDLMKMENWDVTDLESVLVSEGPGSFTGLRIAASAVKGLLFGREIPLYAVSTLAGFAYSLKSNGMEPRSIHSVINARRVHLYHQEFSYSEKGLAAETDIAVRPIKEVKEHIEPGGAVIGTGIERLGDEFISGLNLFGEEYISAKSLIALFLDGEAEFFKQVEVEQFDPNYFSPGQARRK